MGKYTENGIKSRYRLYSVISHYGGLSSGHYTATCRDVGDKWILYDDSVSEIKSSKYVESDRDAYILFYEKIDQGESLENKGDEVINYKENEG